MNGYRVLFTEFDKEQRGQIRQYMREHGVSLADVSSTVKKTVFQKITTEHFDAIVVSDYGSSNKQFSFEDVVHLRETNPDLRVVYILRRKESYLPEDVVTLLEHHIHDILFQKDASPLSVAKVLLFPMDEVQARQCLGLTGEMQMLLAPISQQVIAELNHYIKSASDQMDMIERFHQKLSVYDEVRKAYYCKELVDPVILAAVSEDALYRQYVPVPAIPEKKKNFLQRLSERRKKPKETEKPKELPPPQGTLTERKSSLWEMERGELEPEQPKPEQLGHLIPAPEKPAKAEPSGQIVIINPSVQHTEMGVEQKPQEPSVTYNVEQSNVIHDIEQPVVMQEAEQKPIEQKTQPNEDKPVEEPVQDAAEAFSFDDILPDKKPEVKKPAKKQKTTLTNEQREEIRKKRQRAEQKAEQVAEQRAEQRTEKKTAQKAEPATGTVSDTINSPSDTPKSEPEKKTVVEPKTEPFAEPKSEPVKESRSDNKPKAEPKTDTKSAVKTDVKPTTQPVVLDTTPKSVGISDKMDKLIGEPVIAHESANKTILDDKTTNKPSDVLKSENKANSRGNVPASISTPKAEVKSAPGQKADIPVVVTKPPQEPAAEPTVAPPNATPKEKPGNKPGNKPRGRQQNSLDKYMESAEYLEKRNKRIDLIKKAKESEEFEEPPKSEVESKPPVIKPVPVRREPVMPDVRVEPKSEPVKEKSRTEPVRQEPKQVPVVQEPRANNVVDVNRKYIPILIGIWSSVGLAIIIIIILLVYAFTRKPADVDEQKPTEEITTERVTITEGTAEVVSAENTEKITTESTTEKVKTTEGTTVATTERTSTEQVTERTTHATTQTSTQAATQTSTQATTEVTTEVTTQTTTQTTTEATTQAPADNGLSAYDGTIMTGAEIVSFINTHSGVGIIVETRSNGVLSYGTYGRDDVSRINTGTSYYVSVSYVDGKAVAIRFVES